jgi:LPS export ABC transporter protein LptC
MGAPVDRRGQRSAARRAAIPACLVAVLFAGSAALASEVETASEALASLDAELRVTGMTFVGTRGDASEFVLRADRAHFQPDSSKARLEDVRVVGTHPDESRSFEVACQRGELDIETNDFLAEGNVHGSTGDGRNYRAPWVRYDHEEALLYTDAPVEMRDRTGTFRGDGFRYQIEERRFKLLGNVSVVQEP